jgi:hypothetical protein
VLAWIYEWGCLQNRAHCRLAVGDRNGAREDFEQLAQRGDEVGDHARAMIIKIVGGEA